MNIVRAAEQTLATLMAEREQLPVAIKTAVQRTQRAEVRRLQVRETELNDLIVDAELALIDAQIAALRSGKAALDEAFRRAEDDLHQAEAQHVAAVARLIAAQEAWRSAYGASMVNDMERDQLTAAYTKAVQRAMPEVGEVLYSVTGYRM